MLDRRFALRHETPCHSRHANLLERRCDATWRGKERHQFRGGGRNGKGRGIVFFPDNPDTCRAALSHGTSWKRPRKIQPAEAAMVERTPLITTAKRSGIWGPYNHGRWGARAGPGRPAQICIHCLQEGRSSENGRLGGV